MAEAAEEKERIYDLQIPFHHDHDPHLTVLLQAARKANDLAIAARQNKSSKAGKAKSASAAASKSVLRKGRAACACAAACANAPLSESDD
jgi:hypothetical protein